MMWYRCSNICTTRPVRTPNDFCKGDQAKQATHFLDNAKNHEIWQKDHRQAHSTTESEIIWNKIWLIRANIEDFQRKLEDQHILCLLFLTIWQHEFLGNFLFMSQMAFS